MITFGDKLNKFNEFFESYLSMECQILACYHEFRCKLKEVILKKPKICLKLPELRQLLKRYCDWLTALVVHDCTSIVCVLYQNVGEGSASGDGSHYQLPYWDYFKANNFTLGACELFHQYILWKKGGLQVNQDNLV